VKMGGYFRGVKGNFPFIFFNELSVLIHYDLTSLPSRLGLSPHKTVLRGGGTNMFPPSLPFSFYSPLLPLNLITCNCDFCRILCFVSQKLFALLCKSFIFVIFN
jgi:hypothetical protein